MNNIAENWKAWGKNLYSTYGNSRSLDTGEYFCARVFECLKARQRLCGTHADDGHETICKICQVWFDSDG